MFRQVFFFSCFFLSGIIGLPAKLKSNCLLTPDDLRCFGGAFTMFSLSAWDGHLIRVRNSTIGNIRCELFPMKLESLDFHNSRSEEGFRNCKQILSTHSYIINVSVCFLQKCARLKTVKHWIGPFCDLPPTKEKITSRTSADHPLTTPYYEQPSKMNSVNASQLTIDRKYYRNNSSKIKV